MRFTTSYTTVSRNPRVFIDSTLAEKAAKEWAYAHNLKGAVGGWIYNMSTGRPVCQGWFNVWCRFRRQIEDWYTVKLTASPNFDAFTHPESKTYRPTLLVLKGNRDWRNAFLANAYDYAMCAQGDPRRAYTGRDKE